MIFIYIFIGLIVAFYIYYLVTINTIVKRYGVPEIFLSSLIQSIKINYLKNEKVIKSKSRLTYIFYDHILFVQPYVISYDFQYLRNKIQITLNLEINEESRQLTAYCRYDKREIAECCDELASKLLLGVF